MMRILHALQILFLALGACGETSSQVVPHTPASPITQSRLPIGKWAVADVSDAIQKLRPHMSSFPKQEIELVERAFKTQVIEFQQDHAVVMRDERPWVARGAWQENDLGEVVARVIASAESKELRSIEFYIRGDEFFVVPLGVLIKLKRVE